MLDLQQCFEITIRVIDLGITADTCHPKTGRNPLHQMSESYYLDYDTLDMVCKFLIHIGVDLELEDVNGHTPLLHAAHSSWPASALWLEVLLANGAYAGAVDKGGRGALHLALVKNFLYRYIFDDKSWTIFVKDTITILLRAGCDPQATDGLGTTPE